jgi:hypothetical protein
LLAHTRSSEREEEGMGDSEMTRLVGIDWGLPPIKIHHCITDVLPMTLDWMAAGVPNSFMRRAAELMCDVSEEDQRPATPPYLHPDGTSILRTKPDHPATMEHLEFGHGYTGETLEGYDLDMWHGMSHDTPRIDWAIAAAENLQADIPFLVNQGFGLRERMSDLLDVLREAREQDRWLRGIVEQTIDFHREEA